MRYCAPGYLAVRECIGTSSSRFGPLASYVPRLSRAEGDLRGSLTTAAFPQPQAQLFQKSEYLAASILLFVHNPVLKHEKLAITLKIIAISEKIGANV